MNKLIKINNFRQDYSSHSNILNLEDKYFFCSYINNNKIININNFNLKINNKNIKYSTLYTNPYVLEKKIMSKLNFNIFNNNNFLNINRTNKTNKTNKTNIILLNKIFVHNKKISKYEKSHIENTIIRKKINNNYIGIDETFLILWYLIKYDKNILDKNYLLDLLNYYWLKFILGTFDPNEIILEIIKKPNIINEPKYIERTKFFMSFYVLFEEFHYKYILAWLEDNKIHFNQLKKFILNSNYVKINPQELINNYYGQYFTDLSNLLDQIQIPVGHNILFIINRTNKIYYYDSDEQNLYDIFKFKQLFNEIGFKFINISNRKPIQVINDDGNCLFYCLRFIQYIIQSNISLTLSNLKTAVLIYEKNILLSNDIDEWIKNFV